MLRLQGGQVESLWDEVLPEEARTLPDELAKIDELLRDRKLFVPIEAHRQRQVEERGRSAREHGRPTIAIETSVRLLVVKHRTGWGYETLMRGIRFLAPAPLLPDRARALRTGTARARVYPGEGAGASHA